MDYDLIIVGAGLFGATVARICTDKGFRCLVLERRSKPGGNCMDKEMEGINVHLYGPHIFHTSDDKVWSFIRRFTEFNHFRYSPLACYKGKLYNLPFNLHTFYQLYGITTPEEAERFIKEERSSFKVSNPSNLEEKAMSLIGKKMYEVLVKGYTEKQWGRPCRELSSKIITRLPVRTTFDNNYFNDSYQGIPIGGYTRMIEKMLAGIDVRCKVDYLEDKFIWNKLGRKIVYTGSIDELFDYRFGCLDYRSLEWKIKLFDIPDKQGVAVINYTDSETPFTRIIEHKHFTFGRQMHTIISEEYPLQWKRGVEPYYPIRDTQNISLYKRYEEFGKNTCPQFIFGGRLGLYEYLDMDKTVQRAMMIADSVIKDYS